MNHKVTIKQYTTNRAEVKVQLDPRTGKYHVTATGPEHVKLNKSQPILDFTVANLVFDHYMAQLMEH